MRKLIGAAVAAICAGAAFAKTIGELAEADYAAAVRPIGVDGQAPWNGQAIWFMYPPTFGFTNRADAADYRFAVTDERGGVRTFEAVSANASLAPVWRDLPVGWAKVTCVARAADGRELGAVGERSFWRQAPYRPGTYPRSGRSYAETSKSIGRFVMDLPIVRRLYLEDTPVPAAMVNPSNQVFISYPTKMGASVIKAMASLAASDPSSREEALRIAAGVVRKLAAVTEPEGRPLAGFPRTYEAHPGLSGHPAKMVERNGGKVMLMYPVEAGEAYLDLYAVTQDAALRSKVIRIADKYLELQGADGTWPLNCWLKDGKSVEANRLVPVFLMEFLERVHKLTGEAKYRAAADRAFAYVEKGPLATWNWEGQFEDVVPTAPFQNLTKHNACDTALYLTRRYPRDAKRIAQARELLRFSEDQFVCWERPCHGVGDDPRGRRKVWGVESWRCPAVLEQYNCYVPIDASAAKLIRTYLALYAVERNPLDLAKARTLGDAIVRETRGGYCPTFWFDFCEDWPNCMLASALALGELETHGGALCR